MTLTDDQHVQLLRLIDAISARLANVEAKLDEIHTLQRMGSDAHSSHVLSWLRCARNPVARELGLPELSSRGLTWREKLRVLRANAGRTSV